MTTTTTLAGRWTGGRENAEAVVEFIDINEGAGRYFEATDTEPEHILFGPSEGEQRLNPGEWIVLDPTHGLIAVTPEDFANNFSPAREDLVDPALMKATAPYPEHTKMLMVKDQGQHQGDFLDWLTSDKGYTLCVWSEEDEQFVPVHAPIINLVSEYHDIDQDKIEAEKREMLVALREATTEASDG